MDKKEREERFDGILFSLAEQHKAGVLDVSFAKIAKYWKIKNHDFQFFFKLQLLQTIAGFLARKTDFFTGGDDGEWEKVRNKLKFINKIIRRLSCLDYSRRFC